MLCPSQFLDIMPASFAVNFLTFHIWNFIFHILNIYYYYSFWFRYRWYEGLWGFITDAKPRLQFHGDRAVNNVREARFCAPVYQLWLRRIQLATAAGLHPCSDFFAQATACGAVGLDPTGSKEPVWLPWRPVFFPLQVGLRPVALTDQNKRQSCISQAFRWEILGFMPWLLKQKDHLMPSTMLSCRPVTWTACRHWNGTREGAHVGGLRRKFISQKWCVPKNHAQDTIQVANYFIFFLTQPPFPTAIAAFPHPQKAPSATSTVWGCVSFAVAWASHFWYDVSASARLVQTHQGWYRCHFLDVHHSDKRRFIWDTCNYLWFILFYVKKCSTPKKSSILFKIIQNCSKGRRDSENLVAMGQCCANPQRDDFDAWHMICGNTVHKNGFLFFLNKNRFHCHTYSEYLPGVSCWQMHQAESTFLIVVISHALQNLASRDDLIRE